MTIVNVDEKKIAEGIPAPMLEALRENNNKKRTIHELQGQELSGKGFVNKAETAEWQGLLCTGVFASTGANYFREEVCRYMIPSSLNYNFFFTHTHVHISIREHSLCRDGTHSSTQQYKLPVNFSTNPTTGGSL